MGKDKGWIKLEKNIDDFDFMDKKEPFDKTHAYIDMKILCNYENYPFSPRGGETVIIIHRGQFHTSIDNLAKRWRWSKNKTVGYLKKLEAYGIISTTSHEYGTTITLLKYDDSVIDGTTNGTTNGSTSGATKGSTNGSTDGSRLKKDKNSLKEYKESKEQKKRAQRGLNPWEGDPE